MKNLLRRRVVGLVVILGLAVSSQAAEEPLPVEEAVRLALDREPGELALRDQSQALSEDAVAAAQLPDPMLRAGVVNLPSESLDFDREPMTQFVLGLQQQFLPGSTRRAAGAMLEAEAAAVAAQAEERMRMVSLSTRREWLELYYWLQARDTIDANRRLFSELVRITQSLYAVGKKDQHDVIRAQLELHRLDDRLIDVAEKAALARAELARWIGTDADRPLTDRLPEWGELDTGGAPERLRDHPRLAAADEQIHRGEQGVALAKSRYKPSWSLDLSYGFRDGQDQELRPREDFLSFVVRTELPLFTGQRQDRRLSAAHERYAAAVQLHEEQRRQLQRELDRQLARWRQLGRRVEIFDRKIVPESELRSRAALLSYQSDKGDFTDVMRAYMDELDVRLERVRLEVDRLQAHAHVLYLLGENS